jgi:2'-5' RNA ligase
VSALSRVLPPDARLTRASKWHVTLAFLGAAPPPAVAAALDDVEPVRAFSLRLVGAGNFGKAVWAGIDGDLGELSRLRDRIRGALTGAGFKTDDRPFQPHLTVSYQNERSVYRALSAYSGADWRATEFALVNSHDGEYETLQTWPLPE